MQNISQDYNENLTDYAFENNEYTAATPLMHSATSTFQPTPQQNNALLMCQKISSSIKALKKNAKRQLEQADELKDQLNQLKQTLNAQQQSPMPRHINRGRVHRSHPYPLVSSPHSPSIRPSVSAATYYRDDNLSFSSHPQQANISVETVGFPASFQNSEFSLSKIYKVV